MPTTPLRVAIPTALQALDKSGKIGGVFISLPYLSLRCEQMAPSQPQSGSFPNWLDCYLTVLQPLPVPTGGLLGSTYRSQPLPTTDALVAEAASRPAATAAFVFEEM